MSPFREARGPVGMSSGPRIALGPVGIAEPAELPLPF
jgi:hypothetical protein